MGKSLVARWFAALNEKEIEELKELLLDRQPVIHNYRITFLPWIENAYKVYPRKIGKASGTAKLKRNIKSPEDAALLEEAAKNYAAYCKKNSIEQQYIMHFSTFATRWRDWCDDALDKLGVSRNLVPSFSSVFADD